MARASSTEWCHSGAAAGGVDPVDRQAVTGAPGPCALAAYRPYVAVPAVERVVVQVACVLVHPVHRNDVGPLLQFARERERRPRRGRRRCSRRSCTPAHRPAASARRRFPIGVQNATGHRRIAVAFGHVALALHEHEHRELVGVAVIGIGPVVVQAIDRLRVRRARAARADRPGTRERPPPTSNVHVRGNFTFTSSHSDGFAE